MMNKRGAVNLIVLGLIAATIVGLFASGIISTGSITGDGGYIERPVFKYIKCEPISQRITGIDAQEGRTATVEKTGTWAQKPSVSSSYDVIITTPSSWTSNLGQRYIEYYICNQRSLSEKAACTSYAVKQPLTGSNREYKISNVQGNQYVWMQYQLNYLPGLWKSSDGASYKISYVPYGLREYNPLGGGGIINGQDCSVALTDDSWKDRYISTDSAKIKSTVASQKNTQERTLDPEEVRWYVAGSVTSAAPSFTLSYKGQQSWCKPDASSASIYKINEIKVGSGTYKIASVDWSDKIGTETCCPGDKQPGKACSSDFKWVSTENAECSAFNPCDGAQWTPSQSKEIAKYSCVQSKCVRETKKVSCSSDTDCIGENKLCDRSSWTCVEGNVNLNGEKVKTVADNSADCAAVGGVWKTEKTKVGGIFGIGAKDVVTDYCDLSAKTRFWFTVAILSFLAVLAFIFKGQIIGVLHNIKVRLIG